MTVVILKILLTLFALVGSYSTYFIINEYKKFYKSKNSEDGSMFDRFVIAILAFSGVSFVVALTVLSIMFLFSKITIDLFF